MFDIAWSELLVVGAVALVAIPPKDLPKAMRSVGEFVGKIRRMAGEFQGQFNDAMRDAELTELRKQVEGVGDEVRSATSVNLNPIQTIRDELSSIAKKPTASDMASTAPLPLQADVAVPLPEPLPPPVVEPAVVEAATAPKPKRSRAKAPEAAPAPAPEPALAPEPAPAAAAPVPKAKRARAKAAAEGDAA